MLFGFLEELRAVLIEELWPHLRPLETDYGRSKDVRDLEIGHILYQVRGVRLPRDTYALLRALKDMRDALAHLEPVPADLLFKPEVLAQC